MSVFVDLRDPVHAEIVHGLECYMKYELEDQQFRNESSITLFGRGFWRDHHCSPLSLDVSDLRERTQRLGRIEEFITLHRKSTPRTHRGRDTSANSPHMPFEGYVRQLPADTSPIQPTLRRMESTVRQRRIDVTSLVGLAVSLALTVTIAIILVSRMSFNARATPVTAAIAGDSTYGPADQRSSRRLARISREVGHWFDYTYEWDGRTYRGRDCTHDPPGPTVEVLVDPHDPSVSATQPHTTRPMAVLLAFGVLLVLVSASRVDWQGLRGEPEHR